MKETKAVIITRKVARYWTEILLFSIIGSVVMVTTQGIVGIYIAVTFVGAIIIMFSLVAQKAYRDLDIDKDNHALFGSSCNLSSRCNRCDK